MNTRPEHDDLDQSLWRKYRQARVATSTDGGGYAGSPVDAVEVAAYLDGRLDETRTAAFERRLATDAGLLKAVRELRDLEEAQPMIVPVGVLNRWVALGQPAEPRTEAASPRRRRIRPWLIGAEWLAAAAVVMLACFAGYTFGSGAQDFENHAAAASSSDSLLPMPNGDSGEISVFTVGDAGQEGGAQ